MMVNARERTGSSAVRGKWPDQETRKPGNGLGSGPDLVIDNSTSASQKKTFNFVSQHFFFILKDFQTVDHKRKEHIKHRCILHPD